jgi:hypothetical protein
MSKHRCVGVGRPLEETIPQEVPSLHTVAALFRERLTREKAQLQDNGKILRDLASQSYVVFKGALPNRCWFNNLYNTYDDVSRLLLETPALLDEWHRCVESWQRIRDTRQFFCGTPTDFRDRSTRADKRDKEYLQYSLDFATSSAFRDSVLSRNCAVVRLFGMLEELHFACADLFFRVIDSITAEVPEAKSRLLYDGRLAPIIIKVLRYNRRPERFATDPHFDKSALSLLLNSDDKSVSYRLGRYVPSEIRYSELFAPIEYPPNDDQWNDAVLISGLCLREVGLSALPPTPHSVLPVQDRDVRHSVVAFYLVPYLDTTHMTTNAPYINDLLPGVG